MSGSTTRGWPYVTPDDHPREYPAFSQQQALFADPIGKATVAVKAADQTNIASGGSSGLTATLTGVRIGQTVLATITSVFTASATTSSYTVPTPTGLTPVTSNPVAPCTGGTTATNQVVVGVYTATAATVSMGYTMTHANNGAWTCKAQSSIVLIAV